MKPVPKTGSSRKPQQPKQQQPKQQQSKQQEPRQQRGNPSKRPKRQVLEATQNTTAATKLNRQDMKNKELIVQKKTGKSIVSVQPNSVTSNTPDFESQDPLGDGQDMETQDLFGEGLPLNLSMPIADCDIREKGNVDNMKVSSKSEVAQSQAEVPDEAEPTVPDELTEDGHDETVVVHEGTTGKQQKDADIEESDQQEEHSGAEEINWRSKCENLEAEKRQLCDQLKKAKKKISKLEEEKRSSEDLAIRLAKELNAVKDKHKIPMAKFTNSTEINISVEQLDELSVRSTSDSTFVGLLLIHLFGTDRLKKMSVTGEASHRFLNSRTSDGTALYPPTEKIDPAIVEFICNKVAQRTAIREGPENAATIRSASSEKLVKRYIAQKISNLRKAGRN